MEINQKQKIIILGSTGSIGQQALNVCRRLNYDVVGLSCSYNIKMLYEQIKEFKPQRVAVADHNAATELTEHIKNTANKNRNSIWRCWEYRISKEYM